MITIILHYNKLGSSGFYDSSTDFQIPKRDKLWWLTPLTNKRHISVMRQTCYDDVLLELKCFYSSLTHHFAHSYCKR